MIRSFAAPAVVLVGVLGLAAAGQRDNPYSFTIDVPRLAAEPVIDGDLSEWRELAHSDGVWDMARIAETPWYDPARNRLTGHGDEPAIEDDLSARYYIAWDATHLYLGAEVRDNRNDVADPEHEPKRWYYKDAICWFIEAPRTAAAKRFEEGDNAFCFVADAKRPEHAAWWRHGVPGESYVEEPLQADYALAMDPWGRSDGDFVLEARVDMKSTFGVSSPRWHAPKEGDEYGLEIVHTDPDGGAYGGHFIIYGRGDDDSTWGVMKLAGPKEPIERKSN